MSTETPGPTSTGGVAPSTPPSSTPPPPQPTSWWGRQVKLIRDKFNEWDKRFSEFIGLQTKENKGSSLATMSIELRSEQNKLLQEFKKQLRCGHTCEGMDNKTLVSALLFCAEDRNWDREWNDSTRVATTALVERFQNPKDQAQLIQLFRAEGNSKKVDDLLTKLYTLSNYKLDKPTDIENVKIFLKELEKLSSSPGFKHLSKAVAEDASLPDAASFTRTRSYGDFINALTAFPYPNRLPVRQSLIALAQELNNRLQDGGEWAKEAILEAFSQPQSNSEVRWRSSSETECMDFMKGHASPELADIILRVELKCISKNVLVDKITEREPDPQSGDVSRVAAELAERLANGNISKEEIVAGFVGSSTSKKQWIRALAEHIKGLDGTLRENFRPLFNVLTIDVDNERRNRKEPPAFD